MENYTPKTEIINIAAYGFFTIINRAELKDNLLKISNELEIKGTIILSPEGLNLMLSGQRAAIDTLKKSLIVLFPELESVEFKESLSDFIPFDRMKVKLKPSVIPFRNSDVDVNEPLAQFMSPKNLKAKLDANEDFILLDTRNDYEIEHGTFSKAKTLRINEFSEFGEACQKQLKDKEKPVVMFCTGGIRCEKAAPYLVEQGFKNVYQLDGGILNYFKECGNAHYDGKCFVFDQRVAVGADLGCDD